jgi:hypothetical protein
MMTPGAKRSSSARKPRRTLPSAERRLRASFPEVWAWYELIVSARGTSSLVSAIADEETPRRSSARR